MTGLVVEVLFKGRVLQVVPFDRSSLRIGRMRENEIVVDNLSVSRFHARLQLVDGRVFLDDNGSENGTFVSGTRVHGRVEINPGDAIAVGKHQLRVRSDLGDAAAAAPPPAPANDAWDPAKTYVAGPEIAAPAVARRSEESPAMRDQKPASPDEAAFELGRVGDAVFDLAGPDEGEAVELAPEPDDVFAPPAVPASHAPSSPAPPPSTATLELAAPSEAASLYAGLIVQREGRIERVVPWTEELLTVGRSADCDLVLEQDEVSRRHAQFRRSGERYEVHDLGSVNGTLVNGRRVDRRILEVGDVIQVEGYQLTFVIDHQPLDGVMKPAAAPAPAGARVNDAFAMTILQEALPQRSGFAAPVAETPAADGEADLLEGVELEEIPASPIDDRKELASARPRGSSRASSVQDLGQVEAPPRAVTLELRLRLDELPEPLRRAFAELEVGEIALPAELRLRISE